MSTAMTIQVAVTADELRVLADRVGVKTFPTVLAIRSRYAAVDVRDAAADHATRTLTARRLISEGTVDPDVATMLQVLERPDRELAMRLVTPDGLARVGVARRGALCVSARRVGDQIALQVVGSHTELRDAAAALFAELPAAPAAEIEPVGAPLEAMAEALSGSHDPAVLADQVRALGADARAAMLLGSAMGSRQAFAEIIYQVLGEEDRVERVPVAVGVFYTKRGRVVGAPSVSPAGQRWTTLKPGTPLALNQALSQLVELSPQRWEGA